MGAPEPLDNTNNIYGLKVGGRRFYKMTSPKGQEHFSVQDYASISPKTNFKYISSFCDKDENTNPEFYGSENNLDFSEANGVTTVMVTIKFKTLAILEMMIEKALRKDLQ